MYRHALLAADLAEDTELVIERAAALAEGGTRLTVIHVIEPLALAYGAEMPIDIGTLQDEVNRRAQEKLDAVSERLGIGTEDRLLVTGTIEKEVLRVATERSVDLIVLGSHSRRGLAVLLGSTANAVLQHAPCDVLAVRIARH